MDVGFVGSPYTWARGVRASSCVLRRLNRAICSVDWRIRWSDTFVRHLPHIHSDHAPLLLNMCNKPLRANTDRPFRFLAAWLSHPHFVDFVSQNWTSDSPLPGALTSLANSLKRWNHNVFGNIFNRKNALMVRISSIQRALDYQFKLGLLKLEKKLRNDLDKVMHQEELLWFQNSRENWVIYGDRNTKFFHTTTLVRRNRNTIRSLRKGNCNWVTDPNKLQHLALEYFMDLFSEDTFFSHIETLPHSFPR